MIGRLLPHRASLYIFAGIIAFFFAFYSGFTQIKKIYQDYWGAEGQSPQGTIYSVQTVQFNVANSAMPITASLAIMENNTQYLQELTESAFGLNGFIITACDQGSTESQCTNESPLAFTSLGFNWINEDSIDGLIKKSDYTVLTSEPDLGIDWRYTASKNDSIMNLDFSPPGEIIGRLYYARRPAPSFSEQWSMFSSRLWRADNMAIKYYMNVVGTHTFAFVTTVLLFFFIYRIAKRNEQTELEKAELSARLKSSDEQVEKSKRELSEAEEKYLKASENIDILRAKEAAEKARLAAFKERTEEQRQKIKTQREDLIKDKSLTDDLLNEMEKELKHLESNLASSEVSHQEKSTALNASLLEKSELNEVITARNQELEEKRIEVESLEELLSRRSSNTTLSEKAVGAFITGLNIASKNTFKMHPNTYDDIRKLEKSKSVSYESVIDIISRIAKVDSSDSSFTRTFEALRDFDSIYHSKQQKVRIYFRRKHGETVLLGIWDQSEAPHKQGDKHWRTLSSRDKN
jgi:hypothetical protein